MKNKVCLNNFVSVNTFYNIFVLYQGFDFYSLLVDLAILSGVILMLQVMKTLV